MCLSNKIINNQNISIMRKNFLLLMLMALLPLAGWAADLKNGTLVAPSPYYGKTPGAVSVFNEGGGTLTLNTDYTFDGYFATEACDGAKLTDDQLKALNAGTVFYAKVTGINGYENSLIRSVEVKKMPLKLTGTAGTKTYGTSADGTVYTISSVLENITLGAANLTSNFNGKINITRDGGNNKGDYALNATITDANLAKNYTIASTDITNSAGTTQAKYSITAKAFAEGTGTIGVTVTVTSNLTYNGAPQEATVEVKDNALNTVLTKGTDYDLTFTNNTAAGSSPQVKISGKGNYNNSDIYKNFDIAPAPLLVTPTAKKEYNGANAVPIIPANVGAFTGDVKFTFQGFVDDRVAENVSWTTASTTWSSSDATVNKGTYKLAISSTNDLTLVNYTFIPIEGTFEITQKPITFTAADKTINYGDAEEYALTTAWESTAVTTDKDNLRYAIKITRAATAETGGANAGKYKLTPAFMTDAEIDAKVDADGTIAANNKAAKKQDVKTARDNYNPTFANGYATINKAPLQIALKESAYTLTKVYDGQSVSVTLDKVNGLTILGKKSESDDINLDNLTLTVVNNKADVNTYQISLSGATAENYNITYIPSQYKITARPLKVTIYDQTFKKDAVPSLNDALYDIQEGVANEGLIKGDKVFKLAIDWTVLTKDGDGKITSTAGSYSNAIQAVDEGSSASKYANYNVIQTKGRAVIVANPIVLDDNKAYTAWDATPAGDPTPNSSIMFTKRDLNAEKWNALVLPFEVAVKDLAAAFDYAVVDVLDETQSDGNVHFKLKVSGKIAANTPFLIYPSDKYNNLNQVTFSDVTIEKGALANATVQVQDKSGNKFVGTYKDQSIYGSKYQYVSGGKFYAATQYTEASPATIKPLRAYLDLTGNVNGSRAIIFIDEPDGTTTAIKAVDAEQMLNVVNAEGWYNLNGVKLEGAPTQKGIYIKNGKKIVVK